MRTHSGVDVKLGVTTVKASTDRTELRGRVGEGWSRLHCQVHRANCGERLLEEKLAVLERQMRADGHTHPIVASDPKVTVWWDD